MTDIFVLTTSAAWRKLARLSDELQPAHEDGRSRAQWQAIRYLSLAPYATADGSGALAEVAKEDAVAACSLALYRANLLFSYKHILNKDYQQANEECHYAITFLQEGLKQLGITTELKENELTARVRCFVNSLASQAELQQARSSNKIAPHLLFVLGMHRSGTSALTGMLAKAGFAVPSDLMPATNANPKGYWESLSIIRLNEDFLKQMESHWSSSLALPSGWSHGISAREWRASLLKIIAEAYGGAKLPIIKDPRFCTLISGIEPWLESRLIETSFLIPIRHPLEVSNSLLEAEGTDLYRALRLWIQSIFMAEQATRGHRRKFIRFDLLIQDPTLALEACLELVAPATAMGSMTNGQNASQSEIFSQATAFIDQNLRRQQPILTEKNVCKLESSCQTRLIDLAEKTFQAITANLANDSAISKSLDSLRPSVFHASV